MTVKETLVIEAEARVSGAIAGVERLTRGFENLTRTSARTSSVKGGFDGITKSIVKAGIVLASLRTVMYTVTNITNRISTGFKDATEASDKFQGAVLGLQSVVGKKLGQDAIPKAVSEVEKFQKTGMFTTSEASTTIKNFVAMGYTVEQASNLMGVFADSAAFGRQRSLAFGEAVVSASEGVKNGNCLVGETEILMDSGEVRTIVDLYKSKDKLKVYSLTIDGTIKHCDVSHVIYNGKKEVYKLTTADGKSVRATENHRFLTPEGWKLLRDITVNDKILTIDRPSDYNEKICENKNSTQDAVQNAVENMDLEVALNSGAIFASQKSVINVENGFMSAKSLTMTQRCIAALNAEQNTPRNERENSLATGVAGVPTQTQRVNAVKYSNPSQNSGSLGMEGGVRQGVGTNTDKGSLARIVQDGSQESQFIANGVTNQNKYHSVSRQKQGFVQWLAEITGRARSLWRELIIQTGKVVNPIGIRYEQQLLINNGENLSLGEMESANYAERQKNSTPTMSNLSARDQKKPLTQIMDKPSVNHVTKVYTLDISQVVSKEFDGVEDVYDLSVPETHNFIASGYVTHNSILSDNAGITKNLSVILKEAGYSAADLSKATSDENVRMALYNGLMKEGSLFTGDFIKLQQTQAGLTSKVGAMTELTMAKIGKSFDIIRMALSQGTLEFLSAITNIFSNEQTLISNATSKIAAYVVVIIRTMGGLLSMLPMVGKYFEGMRNFSLKPLSAALTDTSKKSGKLSDAIDGIGSSAKQAKKDLLGLASFDVINILSAASEVAGGGGTGGLNLGVDDTAISGVDAFNKIVNDANRLAGELQAKWKAILDIIGFIGTLIGAVALGNIIAFAIKIGELVYNFTMLGGVIKMVGMEVLTKSIFTTTNGVTALIVGLTAFFTLGRKWDSFNNKTKILIGILGAVAIAFAAVWASATLGVSLLLTGLAGVSISMSAFALGLDKQRNKTIDAKTAQENLTKAISDSKRVHNDYIFTVDTATASQKELDAIQKLNKLSGAELAKQVDLGKLSYEQMNTKQKDVYKAYIENLDAQQALIGIRPKVVEAENAETKAVSDKLDILRNSPFATDVYKKGIIDAFNSGAISAEDARTRLAVAMVGMSKDASQTFQKDLPKSLQVTSGAINKYLTTDLAKALGSSTKDAFNKELKLPLTIPTLKVGLNEVLQGRTLIPRLAQGGIIESPTYAMVGEAGREAVMPLENNTGWIDELANKINSKGGSGQQIRIDIDGRKMYEGFIDYYNGKAKLSNSNLLHV